MCKYIRMRYIFYHSSTSKITNKDRNFIWKNWQRWRRAVLGFHIRNWIRICRFCMFLGFPDPDPFVRGTVPDLKFLRLKVSYKKKIKNFFFASLKSLKKGVWSGVGSRFVSQRYWSVDPDPLVRCTLGYNDFNNLVMPFDGCIIKF